MKHVSEGWDPLFVGDAIVFVFRPGPDYSRDQIYTSGKRLTNDSYNDAFQMSLYPPMREPKGPPPRGVG